MDPTTHRTKTDYQYIAAAEASWSFKWSSSVAHAAPYSCQNISLDTKVTVGPGWSPASVPEPPHVHDLFSFNDLLDLNLF